MKRLLCITVIGLCLLVGCGTSGTVKPIAQHFTCAFEASVADFTFTGRLQRGEKGDLTVDVETPETIKGMQLIWKDAALQVRLGDFAYDISTDMSEAAPRLLLEVLDVLCTPPIGKIQGTCAVFDGNVCGFDYCFTQDAHTGIPLSLELPAAAVSFQFSAFETVADETA